MGKYLWKVSYSVEGMKGVRKEGGVSRRELVEKMVANVGGQLETFYYAFGDDDAYVICDLPDNKAAAAIATAVSAAGGASVSTIVLLTPEEIDAAVNTSVDYRAPGK